MSQHYRSIWISDVHLGTRGCSADALLSFLKETESDNLFLVGDIIDFWRLKKRVYWPQSHNDVIQKILRKTRKGTKVTYIPGNHDEFVRQFIPFNVGDIEVVRELSYISVHGERFLVTHGDLYDVIMQYHKWLAHLGDMSYAALMEINRAFNWTRRQFGFGYWSLSAYLKHKVKNVKTFVNKYEGSLSNVCAQEGYQGIISGHIHHAEMREMNGIKYLNDGDWTESCTALAETHEGAFVLLGWRDEQLCELARWGYGSDPVKHTTPIKL